MSQCPADPCDRGSMKFVLAPAVSSLCVPTVPALRGLKTSCPHPSTLIPLHIWSPSRSSVLSHSYARGRAAGSSAQLRAERGRKRRKQRTAFQAGFRLSEMEAGGEGRGWVWREGRVLQSLLHLAAAVRSGFPHSPVLALAHFPFCPSSQIVLPLAPEEDECYPFGQQPLSPTPSPRKDPSCWVIVSSRLKHSFPQGSSLRKVNNSK